MLDLDSIGMTSYKNRPWQEVGFVLRRREKKIVSVMLFHVN